MYSSQITKTLFYLHIPKCGGSSFIAHLFDWFPYETTCKVPNNEDFIDDFSNIFSANLIYGHQFFPFTYILPSPVFIITFLRDPIQRTISAYEYIKRKGEHIYHKRLTDTIHTIDQFVTDKYFWFHSSNMQTRMLGAEYDMHRILQNVRQGTISKHVAKELIASAERTKCTTTMLERAKSRLATMPFYGITEYYDKSIKLFAHQLNLNMPQTIYKYNTATPQKHKMRNARYTRREVEALTKYNQYDLELFEFAKGVFQDRFDSIF